MHLIEQPWITVTCWVQNSSTECKEFAHVSSGLLVNCLWCHFPALLYSALMVTGKWITVMVLISTKIKKIQIWSTQWSSSLLLTQWNSISNDPKKNKAFSKCTYRTKRLNKSCKKSQENSLDNDILGKCAHNMHKHAEISVSDISPLPTQHLMEFSWNLACRIQYRNALFHLTTAEEAFGPLDTSRHDVDKNFRHDDRIKGVLWCYELYSSKTWSRHCSRPISHFLLKFWGGRDNV